jgi:Fe-S-cluster containining protein
MESDQSLFECTQCGACCKGFGGTYLQESDITKIAEFVGVSDSDFKQRFCVLSGNKLVLSQQANGYCIFYHQNCTIHSVKPQMCKRWPFLDSLLIDITNWRIMASVCPGMRNDLDDDFLEAAIKKTMAEPYSKLYE